MQEDVSWMRVSIEKPVDVDLVRFVVTVKRGETIFPVQQNNEFARSLATKTLLEFPGIVHDTGDRSEVPG